MSLQELEQLMLAAIKLASSTKDLPQNSAAIAKAYKARRKLEAAVSKHFAARWTVSLVPW